MSDLFRSIFSSFRCVAVTMPVTREMTPVSVRATPMKFLDRRRYDMLIRLRTFGATHGQLFLTTSTAPEAFAAIGEAITQLTALDVAERAASEAARAERKDTARRALVDTLTRAGFTARVLA